MSVSIIFIVLFEFLVFLLLFIMLGGIKVRLENLENDRHKEEKNLSSFEDVCFKNYSTTFRRVEDWERLGRNIKKDNFPGRFFVTYQHKGSFVSKQLLLYSEEQTEPISKI